MWVSITVSPRTGEGNEDKLGMVVQSSLKLAADQGFTSSGIFGFPKDMCTKIMIGELKRFLEDGMNNTSIQMIEFCILDDETLRYFGVNLIEIYSQSIQMTRIWKDFPFDLQQQ